MIKNIIMMAVIVVFTGVISAAGTLDSDKKVSLQFDNVPMASVLNVIAQQYDLNIVQSSQVDQKISVKLDNVSIIDALKAILISNGYNYYLTGDILVVKPMDVNAPGETVAKIITLHYISPASAINAASDLLSAKGKMKAVEDPSLAGKSEGGPRATQVVVVDLQDVVDRVEALLNEMDKPQLQVSIEVRMIETNVDKKTSAGFNWPTSLTTKAHGILQNTQSSSSTSSNAEALGQIQLPDGRWEWGKLSVEQVKLVLDFLAQSGNSKLISDPKITTLDNHAAEISISTVIPIQTINRFSEAGATQDIVSFQDERVGISLLVTPHVVDSDNITLDVNPTVAEIIGYAGPDGNQKPITSERTVQTTITVRNGETAALGGLLKENNIENVQKVFFLGSIPILGNLFRHKTVETSTTDLMILITPSIVRN